MAIYHVNKENYEEFRTKEGKVLFDFYANWCGPCNMIAPYIEEISKEQPELIIAKINVDELPFIAVNCGVQSIPTLILSENGGVKGKLVGYCTKDKILDLVNN